MRLNEIQERFKDTILDHPDVVEQPPADFAVLFKEGGIPLPERLKVYRNNIVGGLTDTLILTFPLLEKLVGKDFLEGMARSFVLENPPESGCLNTYGTGFDKFIADFKPAESLPYLPEVAALEIAMTETYYAGNDTPMMPEDLSAIKPDNLPDLNVKLRNSVRLISSRFPLDEIRNFCLTEEEDNNKTLDLDQGGVDLMIYRPDLEVLIVKLQKDEMTMLKNLQQAQKLGKALESTLNDHPGFNFQDFLQRHIELETFLSLNTNP